MNNFGIRDFLIYIFWFLTGLCPLFAQPQSSIKLVHFSGTHNIPGESIQCIFQDKTGIFWMGSESLGLTRYDGKNHTLYAHNPLDTTTISSGFPVQIVEDHQGKIWVATIKGLNKLDRFTEKFTRYFFSATDSNTLSNDIINDMVIDEYGFIWIATTNGITLLNPEREEFVRLIHNSNYSQPSFNHSFNALHFDSEKNLWAGSTLHGLYRIKHLNYAPFLQQWKTRSLKTIAPPNIPYSNWRKDLIKNNLQDILSITSSSPDSIWLGSQAGLYLFCSSSEYVQKKPFNNPNHSFLNDNSFHSLMMDSENNLWAGTSNNELLVINLNTGSYQMLVAENYAINNLKSNAIREIKTLSNGIIWIATKFAGLHYYDHRQQTFPLILKTNPETPGLNDDFVLSVTEDQRGNLWIGTKAGGLNLYNRRKQQFTYFTLDNQPGSIHSNRVEDIIFDKNETLWLATQVGLESMNTKNYQFSLHTSMHVRNLFHDNSDFLWLGTSNGLYRFSCLEKQLTPLKTRHIHFFDVENNIHITRVFKDSQDVLWIATANNGLFEYHFDTDSLINHLNNVNNIHSISGNLVRDIFEDHKNRLWIGTKSTGLNLYDRKTKSFKHIKNVSELASATIYHILEDQTGNLWMGTHNGILSYNPENGDFKHYTTTHGLQSLIFEINAVNQTADGYFLMGGNHGINMFKPENITYKPVKAPLILTRIRDLNQTLARDISSSESIIIKKNSQYLSFEFALLDYSKPEENKYAYKLSPFDKEWVESGTRNFATYTNLPPGNYTFSVKGSDSMGIWNDDTPLSVKIIIPTPIWKQWWFLPIVILLIIASILIINHFRLANIKKREIMLTREVKERTRDLREAYDKLEESKQQIESHNQELQTQSLQISRQNEELEKHRHHLEKMVTERTRDLEQAKLKAEESDRLKSAFLANMSHEIRTPLNAIMGFIDLLKANQIEEDQKDYVNDLIQSNSNALLQLINDIIDVSMIEANQMVIKKRNVEFDDFLLEIKKQYLSNKELTSGKVELVLSLPENRLKKPIFTAPERVNQIFTNLINNAIKFTDKGSISFGYTPDFSNNHITCFVRDTGCGIAREHQSFLFERFRKIERNQSRIYRGTGLGLSISKNLCELLGGKIWLESEYGKGTTFYFTLPYKFD